ncbi:hypothetical protein C8J57DRAFT_1222738 [Mycena rebaudengoi]|nr:hypothetical protein C8J57DRAFT_1222738 [Mycena rebaudengoi]
MLARSTSVLDSALPGLSLKALDSNKLSMSSSQSTPSTHEAPLTGAVVAGAVVLRYSALCFPLPLASASTKSKTKTKSKPTSASSLPGKKASKRPMDPPEHADTSTSAPAPAAIPGTFGAAEPAVPAPASRNAGRARSRRPKSPHPLHARFHIYAPAAIKQRKTLSPVLLLPKPGKPGVHGPRQALRLCVRLPQPLGVSFVPPGSRLNPRPQELGLRVFNTVFVHTESNMPYYRAPFYRFPPPTVSHRQLFKTVAERSPVP